MSQDLDTFTLIAGLVGGLVLFLFGLDILTRALKQIAGDYIKSLLARVTRNRFIGVATGATITAIIQSSSITTVLLVGFISAGLMSTSQSVAVILGANIGTTITAQILAFKVSEIALPVLAVGFFISKREEWRQYGLIVLGLGLIFFGMSIMSDAMRPLRSYQPFFDLMTTLEHPLLAMLLGAGFTALVQSSSATTGTLIVMAGEGLIGLEMAIAIALGANIGTCITAGLASIGKPREAVRATIVHTLFNVVGVMIWIGFTAELGDLARVISPSHPELTGLERTAAEIPRQIANIHTVFNVINAALFLGFTTQITQFVEWLVPDRPLLEAERFAPHLLDEQLLDTPAIALDVARLEIVHLGALTREMLGAVIPTAISGNRLQIEQLRAMDVPVNTLHHEIIGYLRKVSLANLSSHESDTLIALIKIANDLEHIGDRIARDIVQTSYQRIAENVVISPQTASALANLHAKIMEALEQAMIAVEQEDRDLAKQVRGMKQDFVQLIEDVALHEIARLRADEPRRLMTYAREIELVETLDDIFKTTRRIARTQIKNNNTTVTSDELPEEDLRLSGSDGG